MPEELDPKPGPKTKLSQGYFVRSQLFRAPSNRHCPVGSVSRAVQIVLRRLQKLLIPPHIPSRRTRPPCLTSLSRLSQWELCSDGLFCVSRLFPFQSQIGSTRAQCVELTVAAYRSFGSDDPIHLIYYGLSLRNPGSLPFSLSHTPSL